MVDRDIAIEALSVLCNATVSTVQKRSQSSFSRCAPAGNEATLNIKGFISAIMDADETSKVSRFYFNRLRCCAQNLTWEDDVDCQDPNINDALEQDVSPDNHLILDEDEFFDPRFDYDFSGLKDTEKYYRGGEVYERPCGWTRFALKVLDQYPDGNQWLGKSWRSTQSCPGEWPVSYHGTSKKGAEGIIEGHYEVGSGQAYGRGIYSTPHIADALRYTKTFISKKDGKKYIVILQNRINPVYRKKFYQDRYWLIPIPAGTSDEKEEVMVERAIRPYGLLLKAA